MASKEIKDKGRRKNNNSGSQSAANNICIGTPLQYGPRPSLMNMQQQPQNVFYPSFINSWQFPNMNPSMQSSTPKYQQHHVCLLCKKEPKFTCARCGAYYCSQECQKQDWQNHRFTCFAMPPLMPLKPTTRTSPPISPLPKNKCRVRLTGFRRPNLCYVRSMDPADNEQFLKGTALIDNFGLCAQHLIELPAPNTYALAEYQQQYNRVQILSAFSNDDIRVLFIDKGFVKTLELTDLRKITDHVVKILQQAVAIKLKGVENYVLNENIENYLKQFCNMDFTLEYNEDDEEKEFILNIDSKNTLNKSIASFANKQKNLGVYGEIKLTKENDEKPIMEGLPKRNDKKYPYTNNGRSKDDNEDKTPVLKPPFEIKLLNEGDENLIIIVLNANRIQYGLFGCILQQNKKNLDKISHYFRNYVDTGKIYEPHVNEYCLGQIGENWCRIKILSICDKICTVVNIDTTFEENINSNKIRRYPIDLTFPCTTTSCKIEGLLPIKGSELIDNFMRKRFIVNSQHRVTKVKNTLDGIRRVQMDDLTDELILAFQNLS